ncbi:MAG TPA: GNAT family N-acetyltransferase [Candidatus Scybalocola faecigallinarum]|uniref:GNAT family N-acetyltransferase n=1 Tax=Candidatus Scybalocola faecigallinarum TaxID=2840941 RepID=A0A9D1JRX9_9FIRM|nr:GNAT family N-acetyltransferase [Candidatus Scybalocola faecigallinarum]
MTNKDIWEIALSQSAIDCHCSPEDFYKDTPVVVLSQSDPHARKYIPLPLECDMVSYGSNIVAQVSPRTRQAVEEYLKGTSPAHGFETPEIYKLNQLLEPFQLKVCFMAEYFLPDLDQLKALPCPYPVRILYPEDFQELYIKEWSNALCADRKALDKIAVGAYDQGRLIGLAGASADCERMYQIGVDVLPQYRRQGIASALTSALALEILKLGKVPFYCAAWCNLKSVGNAIKCGFRPAWTELTARDETFVESMLRS